jgi:hypothetical protein
VGQGVRGGQAESACLHMEGLPDSLLWKKSGMPTHIVLRIPDFILTFTGGTNGQKGTTLKSEGR